MKSDDPKMEENELLKHVFTYVPDITKFSMRDILSILKDLHIEDVNSVFDETELEKIKTFVANTRCLNKNPNIINKYITLTETKPYNPKVSPIISPSKRTNRITRQ
jgi:hypothetical protein